ncbi:MAG: CBS domain-containing protein [Nitrososphaerota archaeon]|jgi:CBS domain-containing protein|nr:CBS domain-containing protein [Nitrososphaerota archaeon]MDG6937277.1 CBS domain-containing protein [Nitrososphaerota archaeon]MDG6961363.1 CBS domain-containing protein [Nitrososphaerota archaeon]MDG6962819.1 CBS domain-containing protein [Nitrososphaerota archaeon]MDG6970349.1 CBS domain-containing protein [Nitrososphaerota archaeon]
MIYVKDIMTRKVRTIDADASIKEAAKAMSKWRIGALVIMAGSKPVGIITEGDISRSVARGHDPDATVGSLKKSLITVSPAEKVEVAARIMSEAGIKKLPVMENHKLVGIVTQTDIVGSSFSLVTSLKEMVQARYRPPDFEM